MIWRENLTPFGEEWQAAAANDNNMSFTGHIDDDASGLTYMQARYYDPRLGRFLSNDPMGFADMGGSPAYFNRYAYTANDPVNATDPTGMVGSRIKGSKFAAGGDDNTFRDRMAASGAAAGAIVGGVVGGAAGGTGGAVAGVACGPGAVACSPAGAAAGGVAGAAAGAAGGAAAGGVAGGLIGAAIDAGIVLFNKATGDGGGGGDKPTNGRPGPNTVQNRQVTDAARQEGLNAVQRRELGRAVEAESRQGGANLGYSDIREIARAIKSGNY